MKRISSVVFLGFAVALIASLVSCATDPVTGKRVSNIYSLRQDVELGQATMQQNVEEMQKAHVPINRDQKRLSEIREIVQRLAAVSDLPDLPYSVTLFETNIVNAAAAPGGSMMVFSGLYDPKDGMVQDADEMAAVMGHEIAHVNCRHVTERLTKLTATAAMAEIVAQVAAHNDKKDIAYGVRAAFAVGTALWIPSYTREDESEADRVGLFYMARAGYDPRAAPRIWKRITEKTGSKDPASIFATHPSNWERYNALTKLLPQAMEEYTRATGRVLK